MKLATYLQKAGWTEASFAGEVRRHLPRGAKTNQSTIYRLRVGARTASVPLALAIEAASGGQVKAEHLPMTKQTRALLRALRDVQSPGEARAAPAR